MPSSSSYSMGTWSPSSTPATVTVTSIASTVTPMIQSLLSSVYQQFSTETDVGVLNSLSKVIRGGEATMTVVSAQDVLATATDSAARSTASQQLLDATLNLQQMSMDASFYKYSLNKAGNITFFVCYLLLVLYFAGMLFKSKYTWFNVTFIFGFGLEMMGFLGRILGFNDNSKMSLYIMQSFSLTVAPAVIMAGIYFIFAQLITIHGRQYSYLKPMWYSSVFITVDVFSFFVQGGGGGLTVSKDPDMANMGKIMMISGIVLQIVGMTFFFLFLLMFLLKIYFHNRSSMNVYSKPSFTNFMRLLFNDPSIRFYRFDYLDKFYNSQFIKIRAGKLFNFFPLALTFAVLLIYIRSVFRVVELVQGYEGYLMIHEIYLFTLDAAMITVSGFVFVPFHPVWIFGKDVTINAKTMRKNIDISSEKSDLESANSFQKHYRYDRALL